MDGGGLISGSSTVRMLLGSSILIWSCMNLMVDTHIGRFELDPILQAVVGESPIVCVKDVVTKVWLCVSTCVCVYVAASLHLLDICLQG